MSFVNFTDPRQVFLDNNGSPNSYGRMSFCQVGTSALKGIYTDSALITSAENPQYFTNAGRLENQIFLGEGDYTVRMEGFNGTGNPKIAPDEDFYNIYNAEVQGLQAS